MAPGTSSMLRARRRDVNVKPNRRLDRSSTRGMIYENEELRLRTINISAEVERGQDDIKKLRRENDALRRELWGLRDEYDKLEALLKKNEAYLQYDFSDCEKDDDEEGADGSECSDQDGSEDSGEEIVPENQSNADDDPQNNPKRELEFDLLSIVPEETDENQTDSQQSQDDADQQRSPAVPRRMYGYPVVDPLTGLPCGVMLPVDEASAAAVVAEISGLADDIFLQPRGGPDLFVEGAYAMESVADLGTDVEDATSQVTLKCISAAPSSPIIIISNEDTPPPIKATTPIVADTPAPDTFRKPLGATLRERRKSALTLQMPLPVTQTVQPEDAAFEDPGVVAVHLTGVPTEATDAEVLAGLAPFGAVLAPIERPAGPSGDERIVRLRRPPQQRGPLPQDVPVAGTRVPLRVLDPAGTRDKANHPGKPFRSQLQVRLKAPAATLPLRRVPSVDSTDAPDALPRASSTSTLQNPQISTQQTAIPQVPAAEAPPTSTVIPVIPRAEWPVPTRLQNPNALRRPFGPGRAIPVPILPATAPATVPVAVPGAAVTVPGVPVPSVTVPVVPVPVPVTVQGDTVAVAAASTVTNGSTTVTNGVTGSVTNPNGVAGSITNPNGVAGSVTNPNGTGVNNHAPVPAKPGTATAQNNPAMNNAINEAVERSQEKLEVPETPAPASATASPATVRRNTKRGLFRKQSSEESHCTLPTPSPGQARKKLLRNCKASSGADSTPSCSTPSTSNNAASRLGALPSPSNAVADHSQSSSSGQDSPHKSDRRRRVSIYLSRRPKKSVAPQHALHSGGSGDGGGDGIPYEHGATTSERERTASASSRDSTWNSRPGPPRRTERRDSIGSGKVPWCGCWGNGCL